MHGLPQGAQRVRTLHECEFGVDDGKLATPGNALAQDLTEPTVGVHHRALTATQDLRSLGTAPECTFIELTFKNQALCETAVIVVQNHNRVVTVTHGSGVK